MTIVVLGNGFDLAHHLPTRYSDFLEFITTVKTDEEFKDNEYSRFIERIRSNNIDLYNEINSLIQDNSLIELFLSIFEERVKEGKEGWIDFESEISFYVQKLDEAKRDIEKQYAASMEPVRLSNSIRRVLKPLINEPIDVFSDRIVGDIRFTPQGIDYIAKTLFFDLKRVTRLLEIYLYEFVEKINCKYRIHDLDNYEIDKVLSFNYTDTYRQYYDPGKTAEYCFIHGKAEEETLDSCSLVLGIDEYLPTARVNSDNQFVWFKKFYQRIYKETGSEYVDWINSLDKSNKDTAENTSQNEILIYGHSLDITDKDVLSRLILMENTTTHIFFHDRDAMAQQISNLVKLIGEENLIRKTGGKDKTIQFIKTNKPELI